MKHVKTNTNCVIRKVGIYVSLNGYASIFPPFFLKLFLNLNYGILFNVTGHSVQNSTLTPLKHFLCYLRNNMSNFLLEI